jgi:ACS family hexuronate transporter-like MFS transporter
MRDPVSPALPQDEATMRTRLAWLLLAVLFSGSVLNYLDRAVLGIVMPQVRRSLSLSNSDYGLVINAFLLLYMVFYVVGGKVADWLGSRRSFVINVIAWSTASVLQALSRGLTSLCFFRGLLGAAEGGFYPTAIRGVSEWFPPFNRAKAIGILLCGLSVGSLVAPPVVAAITLRFGWRAAFVVTGALGFLLLPPWLFLQSQAERFFGRTKASPAGEPQSASRRASDASSSVWQTFRQKKYLFLLAARSITDAVWFFCLFWIPGYFQEVRGFNLEEVGRWLWIPYFFGDTGALAGTWISSALLKKGVSLDGSRKAVLVPSAMLGVCSVGTYYLAGQVGPLGALSIALFGLFSWAGNLQTAITEVIPPQHVAVLYGVTGAVGTLMAALSQLLIGRVVDRVGYEPVFVSLSIGLLVALALVLAAGQIVLWHPDTREQNIVNHEIEGAHVCDPKPEYDADL